MSQSNIKANTLLALQALQTNLKLSLREAAKIYQVPEQRLRRRQKGISSRGNWVPLMRWLSDLEEQTIIKYILDLDS